MNKRSYIFIFFLSTISFLAKAQPFVYPSVKLTNEEKINSPLLEFSPTFFEDGILFVSTMSPGKKYQGYDKKIKKPTMSIFLAKRNDITSELERPIPFALELTTNMHQGPLTFDRNAEKVYYTSNNLKKRRKKASKLKIYESIKSKDGKWSSPKELPFNLDDFDTAHPTISADGHTLIFSSNRPGGMGGMDLYKTTLKDGIWTAPVNMGKLINTEKNEIFPFLHADHTLFFSSDGHLGEGGLDIFYTVKDIEQNYVMPVNLGVPFNSPKDDLGFILDRDKKNGYFSSSRQEGKGEDDIFGFNIMDGDIDEYFYFKRRMPNVLENITFNVKESESNEAVDQMSITFLPLNSPLIDSTMLGRDQAGNIIIIPQSGAKNNLTALQDAITAQGRSGFTNKQGYLSMDLPKGYYAIVSHKENFLDKFSVVSTAEKNISISPTFSIGCTPVMGKVVNNRNQAGVPNVIVKMMDEQDHIVSTTTTDESGTFDACAKCGQIYRFVVEVNDQKIGGAKLDAKNTACKDANAFNIIVPLEEASVALQEGSIIELKNLYFNFNDAAIRANARKDLDDLVAVLNQHPDMEIEIASYTDAVGSKDYNLGISQKRAEKVTEYLISKGINSDRLLPIGYGESGIRNHCVDGVRCSDKEHQFNRRIEIKVTKSSIPVKVTYLDDTPAIDDNPVSPEPDDPSVNRRPNESDEYQTFHVIIGAFLMEQNAEKKLRSIRKLGFDEASITSFTDTPAYHSVVVKTFYDLEEAKDFAKSIKRDYGLKYYIKKLK